MLARPARAISRAFSLVEILIVVLLIGVLSAIAIPQLLGAGDVVGDGAAKAQLETTQTVLATYRSGSNGYAGIGYDPNAGGLAFMKKSDPDIQFVPGNTDSRVTDDIRTVSVASTTLDGAEAAIAASLGENGNCWFLLVVDGGATEYSVTRNPGNETPECRADSPPPPNTFDPTWPESIDVGPAPAS